MHYSGFSSDGGWRCTLAPEWASSSSGHQGAWAGQAGGRAGLSICLRSQLQLDLEPGPGTGTWNGLELAATAERTTDRCITPRERAGWVVGPGRLPGRCSGQTTLHQLPSICPMLRSGWAGWPAATAAAGDGRGKTGPRRNVYADAGGRWYGRAGGGGDSRQWERYVGGSSSSSSSCRSGSSSSGSSMLCG